MTVPLLHMQGVRACSVEIEEYAPDGRVTGILTVSNPHRTRTLRLCGVLDARTMDEIGCHELVLAEDPHAKAAQLEFGRYSLLIRGGVDMSFPVDWYEFLDRG